MKKPKESESEMEVVKSFGEKFNDYSANLWDQICSTFTSVKGYIAHIFEEDWIKVAIPIFFVVMMLTGFAIWSSIKYRWHEKIIALVRGNQNNILEYRTPEPSEIDEDIYDDFFNQKYKEHQD